MRDLESEAAEDELAREQALLDIEAAASATEVNTAETVTRHLDVAEDIQLIDDLGVEVLGVDFIPRWRYAGPYAMVRTENEQRLAFMFDDALKLRDAGDLVAARQMLEALVAQLEPADRRLLSHAHTQLGHLCEQLADHEAWIAHCRAAVTATPWYDLPSLGLFHALYEQKRRTEAFQEMVRFLRRSRSADYTELATGLSDEWDPAVRRANYTAEQKQLIAEARRLLTKTRH